MSRERRPALIAAGVGLAALAVLIGLTPHGSRAPAWLAACLLAASLPLAALAALLIHDLTGGAWGFALRPILMRMTATLPLVLLAALPLLLDSLPSLYPWARPAEAADLANRFYLNVPFFAARAALDAVLWLLVAAVALRRAAAGALAIDRAGAWVSALGLIALGLSITFAAIDWVESLEPRWSSSIFGMIAASALFLSGFAAAVLAAATGPAAATPALCRALASLLLSVALLWAYLQFMQFLIIWEEDLVREIPWYLRRLAGGWGGLAAVIVAGRFALPFFVLIWRPLKQDRLVLATVAAVALGTGLLEAWWLVLPAFPGTGFTWTDPLAAVALGGLWLAAYQAAPLAGRLGGAPAPSHG